MSVFMAPVRYFLGSLTPQGFVGTQHTLYDVHGGWVAYLLKGGPGTGKSTLLRRICTNIGTENTEVFCCSSDPRSLDAVRLPDRKITVLDATAPHAVEPQIPVAAEQAVCLTQCLDPSTLKPLLQTLIPLFEEKAALYQQAQAHLSTTAAFLTENRRVEQEAVDFGKIDRLVHRLSQTEWEPQSTDGTVETRFLSAVTPEGLLTFFDTVQALCPRIYSIEDEHGTASRYLLQHLQTQAVSDGQRCLACPSPLFPHDPPAHLLFPEIGVAFLTSNSLHKVDFPVYRRIHAARFLDAESIAHKRRRLAFCRRTASNAIAEAVNLIGQAAQVHRAIESQYTPAMNWDTYRTLSDTLLTLL